MNQLFPDVNGTSHHLVGPTLSTTILSRTTPWKKPKLERPAGSLMPECVIEGHSECIWSLAYLGTSGNIMSTSEDSSIHQWKRDGEPVGNPSNSYGGGILSMAVSPDETMDICGSVDACRLRLWNIKEGSMIGDPWEGHNAAVRCLDWSRNSLEMASGSEDGTIRRWNPDTSRQMAPPIGTSHEWVIAVKYSPQGDKFMSGGNGPICIWSKDGKLLIEIKGHDRAVSSLCWSKDGAHIFSASLDETIPKWRAIDGQELVVLRGHTLAIRCLCLTPDESYITNHTVRDPFLHDDELLAVVMSRDGKYIASAGLGTKIYVWNLEAALENVVGADDGNTKLKECPAQPRVCQPIAITRGSAKYGNDFFGNDSDCAALPASSSFLHWRSLIGSLWFSTQPTDTARPSLRTSRHCNFNLLLVRNSSRTFDVAPARDEDRYGIVPATDAEAAAAMQRTNSNQANSATQSGQPAGAQGSQARPTETHQSTGGRGEVPHEVNCCGFYFSRRSTSRQS